MAAIVVAAGNDLSASLVNAKGGDIVILAAGNHKGAKLIGRKFPDGSPLTIRGEPGSVITSGTTTGEGINLEGSENVVLENLTVQGMAGVTGGRNYVAGIRVVESKGIRVVKCKSSGNKTWGFFSAFVQDLEYVDCEADGNLGQHGFYVSNSSKNVRHIECKSTGNAMCGFHNNGDASARDGSNYTGFIENLTYIDCIASGNGRLGGSAFNFDGCQRVKILDCIATGNLAGGMAFYRGDGAGPCSGVVLHGNDIELPATVRRAAVQIVNGSGDLVIWGNRFKHNDPARPELLVEGGKTVGLVSDYNRIERFQTNDDDNGFISHTEWMTRTGQDTNTVPHWSAAPAVPPLPKPATPEYAAELVDATYAKPTVTVRMKNTGTATWPKDGTFRLGTQNPEDNRDFGVNRLFLADGPTAPGVTGTFSANLTASASGTLTLRPLIEHIRWLASPTVTVPIAAPVVPPVVPPPVPEPSAGIVAELTGEFRFLGIWHDVTIKVKPNTEPL